MRVRQGIERAAEYRKLHSVPEPEGVNQELRKKFYSKLDAMDKKNFPSSGDYCGPYSPHSSSSHPFTGMN